MGLNIALQWSRADKDASTSSEKFVDNSICLEMTSWSLHLIARPRVKLKVFALHSNSGAGMPLEMPYSAQANFLADRAEGLQLEGKGAFEAAFHCAAVTAALRAQRKVQGHDRASTPFPA